MPERFKKYCSQFGKEKRESGLFGFWLRFGSVTGFCKPAPSPKPRQKTKILAPNWLQYFLNRSKCLESFESASPLRSAGALQSADWRNDRLK
jgi:hypothetical protein